MAHVLNHDYMTGGGDSRLSEVLPLSVGQAAFGHAMENGSPTEGFEESAIARAHQFPYDQVERWLATGNDGGSRRAHDLEAAGESGPAGRGSTSILILTTTPHDRGTSNAEERPWLPRI